MAAKTPKARPYRITHRNQPSEATVELINRAHADGLKARIDSQPTKNGAEVVRVNR